MNCRHRMAWLAGLVLIPIGGLSGCGPANPPVAETPPPSVTVSQPVVDDVVDQDDYEGRIAAAQMVEVRARVRGHLVKVCFQEGQLITKDAPLYEIDPRTYEAELEAAKAQLASADASNRLARAEHDRNSFLIGKGAVSREDLEVTAAKVATSQADKLKAEAAMGRVQLDLNFCKVSAPLSGRISKTQVDVGNLVNAGGGETLLTTIVSVDPMYVYFDVPERTLQRYRQHFRKAPPDGGPEPALEALKIPVYVGLEGEEGYPHKGVIDYADPRVSPSTGTKEVRGELPNAKRLLDAGMRARVRIPVSNPHKALLITERAIGSDQGRKFVYVVNDQKIAERRDVKLGRLSEGLQVITEGLKPEDLVIVNGIQRVRDGAKVEPRQVPMPGAPAK